MKKTIFKPHKLIFDMTSQDYHSVADTYSSSQLKDLLDDEEIFIKKYVHKTIERESIPAFDVGNYFHTGVLEPEKLTTDCVVFQGKIRRGDAWDKFRKKNEGKAILTSVQKEQSEGLIACVQNSPVAMGYVQKGRPEVSLFTEICIYAGEIYATKFNKRLTSSGWLDSDDDINAKAAVNIVVKVRADSLGNDFVLDLKSTTGNSRSEWSMRQKISHYQYDLSAALYLDMFSLIQGPLDTFIWTFASKDYLNCKSYRATDTNIRVGRAKYTTALLKLADLIKNDWQLYDYLGQLEPLTHELEYIKEKETDLI